MNIHRYEIEKITIVVCNVYVYKNLYMVSYV